jgi:hypothetical protein
LRALLADPAAVRAQQDLLAGQGATLLARLGAAGSPERAELQAALDGALQRLVADASLSQGDRLSALIERLALARLDAAKDAALPPALVEQVRAEVARADREVQGADERQSVIPAAAHALGRAGLLDESDALLTAELERSHSPYYAMLQLAANARKRGDAEAALGWTERAWRESKGPATRLQWGAGHVGALLELAPQDSARIEAAAAGVYAELDGQPDAFYGRNARVIEKMNARLAAWSAQRPAKADRVVAGQRLQAQLVRRCDALAAAETGQRATCDRLGALLAGSPKAASKAPKA